MIYLDIEKKNEILSKAYTDSQNLISLADSKANISLTTQSLLITISLGFALLFNIFEKVKLLMDKNIGFGWFYIIVIIMYVGLSIIGIITTILVYKPREALEEAEKKREGLFYFKHVLEYKSSDNYYAKIKGLSEEELMEEYSKQIYQLASIAEKKFNFVNYSIYFLIINTSFTIFFLILSSFINFYKF